MKIKIQRIYRSRFTKKDISRKTRLWENLNELYFQKIIFPNETVLDFGAGYCEFINSIKCQNKIAIDINPELKKYASKKVKTYIGDISQLKKIKNKSVDTVFLSNFLEHLLTKEDVLKCLILLYRVLKPKGKVIILQPNIDLTKEKYWDRIDHHIALNGESVKEALLATNFQVIKYIKRFLPSKSKSIFPQNKLFIKLYFLIPSTIRPWAGKSLIIARKNEKN